MMRSVKMGQQQSSAKRASRAVLELAMLLSDGNWHSTGYLGVAAGKYMRPEIAWRIGKENINHGRRLFINVRLDMWERAGRIAKRRNGKFTEWRLAKSEWVIPYLKALIEILREQAENHSRLPVGKSRALERIEREQEILRLQKEGFSHRQIAERLECSRMSVSRVVKASKADVGDVTAVTLPLRQRLAIADAPLEKQAEIAKTVAEKRLTVEETKKLVRLSKERA